MRAIHRSGRIWRPETMLDFADARTLNKLLARAGLTGSEVLTPTTEQFLARQQWIPSHNPGLISLRALLATTMQRRMTNDGMTNDGMANEG
jgi:hypothetical protein